MIGAVLAKFASGVAVVAVLALALSGPGTRWGWWSFRLGLLLFALAGVLGIAAAALGLIAKYRPPRGSAAARAAVTAMIIGVTAAALPLWGVISARRVPPIHDVTTDLADPPSFRAAVRARGRRANPAGERIDPRTLPAHQRAYPDLKPLIVPQPPEEAFARAVEVAREMGWEILAENRQEGLIEATATTPWFGFRDDVVIRVRPDPGGSRIDVRSTSRVGRGDLGANAARIRRFLRAMETSA